MVARSHQVTSPAGPPSLPGTANGWSRRHAAWIVATLGLLAVATELAGRAYGLHTPVVYERTDFGYRVVPDQDILRFGHRIHYNSMGLRNGSIDPAPRAGVLRVMCLGDSVTNGGAITDQGDTVPAKLEAVLSRSLGAVEVLNASAPGWAVANEFGWLKAYGTLGSSYVVIIISTHDLFQDPVPSSIVDDHPSFPSRRPYLALQELAQRYIWPRLVSAAVEPLDPGAEGVISAAGSAERNRQIMFAMVDLVEAAHGHPAVAFLEQGSDSADNQTALAAKRQLFAALADRGIPVVTLARELERYGRGALFRDDVHPNPAGNGVIAEAIARRIEAMRMAVLAAGERGSR